MSPQCRRQTRISSLTTHLVRTAEAARQTRKAGPASTGQPKLWNCRSGPEGGGPPALQPRLQLNPSTFPVQNAKLRVKRKAQAAFKNSSFLDLLASTLER